MDGAIDALEHHRGGPVEAVHHARTAIKRARTILRLVRDQLDKQVYLAENDALRSIARRLAPTRDAMVMPDVLDALAARYPAEIDSDELARLRERLAVGRDSAQAQLGDAEGPVADVLVSLRTVRDRLHDLPLASEDALRPVMRGVRRVYARGRRGYRKARECPDTDALHAWRKRVKDLRYAAELLRDADPPRMKRLRREARELSDLLGDDHDLATLAELAGAFPATSRLIARRRRDLQASAFVLGHRLHARPARRLASRTRRRARKRTVWQ